MRLHVKGIYEENFRVVNNILTHGLLITLPHTYYKKKGLGENAPDPSTLSFFRIASYTS